MSSTNEIYDFIKARNFHDDLWLDIISDLKEKPTYKRLIKLIDAFVNNKLQVLSTIPNEEQQRVQRRTFVAEVSIMTHTIDTIISEILYRKLQNQFRSIIDNILEEMRNEQKSGKTLSSSLNSPSTSMLENIENIFSNGSTGKKTQKLQTVAVNKTPTKKSSLISPRKIAAASHPVVVLKRLNSKDSNGHSWKNGKATSIPVPIVGIESDTDKVSDFGSEKSDLNVSSVNTSDLSSFEDAVSISSASAEEGGAKKRKKKVPLRIASELYTKDKLSEIYESVGKLNELKYNMAPFKRSLQAGENNSYEKIPASTGHKPLPQRVRKPNSKYVSDSVVSVLGQYSTYKASGRASNHGSSSDDEGSSYSEEERKIRTSTPKKKLGRPRKQTISSTEENQSALNELRNDHTGLSSSSQSPGDVSITKRKRGRPRKDQSDSSPIKPSTLSDRSSESGMSIKKKVGRPRKETNSTDNHSTLATSPDIPSTSKRNASVLKESSCSDGESLIIDVEKDSSEGETDHVATLKKKRGRPRKADSVDSVGKVLVSPKNHGHSPLKKKLGRPRKDASNNHVVLSQVKDEVVDDSEQGTAARVKRAKVEKNTSSRSSSQRYEQSDLYKPRHTIFSLF